MLLKDINPYVRFVRDVGAMRPRVFNPTRNYDNRLFFIKKADCTLLIDGKNYKLSNNDAVFLPPASHYQLTVHSDGAEIYAIGLDFDVRYSEEPDAFTSVEDTSFDEHLVHDCGLPNEFCEPIVLHAPDLRGKFDRCYDELRLRPIYFRETASGVVKLILTDMLRRRSFNECESGITNAVIDYIKKNYKDANLSNVSIANYFDYHPYYLSRVMKQTTGKPLHKYISEYRVDIAKSLLVADNLDISTIAGLCGFTSASYFTKVFRDKCGIAPTAYRREYSEIV